MLKFPKMEKKDVILENFKQALTSTIKSISERNDCNIIFGKQTSQEYKNVNLPEIKKLEDFQDFLTIRAKADSEALRIKHSDEGIFNDCSKVIYDALLECYNYSSATNYITSIALEIALKKLSNKQIVI